MSDPRVGVLDHDRLRRAVPSFTTYLSSAAVTAMVLLFVAVTGYLLLGRSPDPESQKSESSNPDGETGPEAGLAEAE